MSGTVFPQIKMTLPNGELSGPWRFFFQNLYQATGGGASVITASSVSFVPAGTVTVANVQLAIAQLDTLKVPVTRSVNGHPLSADVTVTASDVGAVPTSRTVNGHPLSANVTVTASDVGAPSGSGTSTGTNTGDQFTSETASTLIGRGDSGAGPAQEITLGTGLLMTGTVLSAAGGAGTGTVTSVSVATANGFAGTVATATTTPAITLTTSITGLLKGNGTAISAAAAGSDYVAPTTTVNGHALSANVTVTATDVGLGSVTNDAQTKAAIVPNTVPSAGQVLAGNAGGTAFAAVSVSGDATLASTGAMTVASIGGKAVSLAGALTTSGAFASTFTMTGVTAVTFPTSGTLATVSGALGTPASVTLTNGTGLPISTGVSGLAAGAATFLSSAVGFETMLANVTLGSAGASLASGTIAARKFLRIEIYIPGYAGSDTASLQFNGAAGTAYRYRWWTMPAGSTTAAAGLTAASTDRIKIAAANTTNARNVTLTVRNDPNVTEKLVKFLGSVFGTGSAATQATEDGGNGAWVSGATTSITSVSLVSSSNMNAGTQMTIFGWN